MAKTEMDIQRAAMKAKTAHNTKRVAKAVFGRCMASGGIVSAPAPAPKPPVPAAPAPSLLDRFKASFSANQVAGQGAVGQAQAGRTKTIDDAEKKALGMANGGVVPKAAFGYAMGGIAEAMRNSPGAWGGSLSSRPWGNLTSVSGGDLQSMAEVPAAGGLEPSVDPAPSPVQLSVKPVPAAGASVDNSAKGYKFDDSTMSFDPKASTRPTVGETMPTGFGNVPTNPKTGYPMLARGTPFVPMTGADPRGNKDEVPALLSEGEAVLPKRTVNQVGKENILNLIEETNGPVPGYAVGGIASRLWDGTKDRVKGAIFGQTAAPVAPVAGTPAAAPPAAAAPAGPAPQSKVLADPRIAQRAGLDRMNHLTGAQADAVKVANDGRFAAQAAAPAESLEAQLAKARPAAPAAQGGRLAAASRFAKAAAARAGGALTLAAEASDAGGNALPVNAAENADARDLQAGTSPTHGVPVPARTQALLGLKEGESPGREANALIRELNDPKTSPERKKQLSGFFSGNDGNDQPNPIAFGNTAPSPSTQSQAPGTALDPTATQHGPNLPTEADKVRSAQDDALGKMGLSAADKAAKSLGLTDEQRGEFVRGESGPNVDRSKYQNLGDYGAEGTRIFGKADNGSKKLNNFVGVGGLGKVADTGVNFGFKPGEVEAFKAERAAARNAPPQVNEVKFQSDPSAELLRGKIADVAGRLGSARGFDRKRLRNDLAALTNAKNALQGDENARNTFGLAQQRTQVDARNHALSAEQHRRTTDATLSAQLSSNDTATRKAAFDFAVKKSDAEDKRMTHASAAEKEQHGRLKETISSYAKMNGDEDGRLSSAMSVLAQTMSFPIGNGKTAKFSALSPEQQAENLGEVHQQALNYLTSTAAKQPGSLSGKSKAEPAGFGGTASHMLRNPTEAWPAIRDGVVMVDGKSGATRLTSEEKDAETTRARLGYPSK